MIYIFKLSGIFGPSPTIRKHSSLSFVFLSKATLTDTNMSSLSHQNGLSFGKSCLTPVTEI